MSKEIFPLVNEQGETIGSATRKECHSGSFLLHPVVHLHVFNSEGKLYLQKRAMNKDIQPGKWDTAVGGHVDLGETVEQALRREASEELKITDFEPIFAIRYVFQSEVEREMVNSFYTFFSGLISPDEIEISEGKFWDIAEINSSLGKNIFTPNFESEFPNLMEVVSKRRNDD
jgi:isopentenyldiphosphate isomerase